MTPSPPTDWKKEFREQFGLAAKDGPILRGKVVDAESFIESVLADQRREVLEEAAKVAYRSLEHHHRDKDGNEYWTHSQDVAQTILALGEKK